MRLIVSLFIEKARHTGISRRFRTNPGNEIQGPSGSPWTVERVRHWHGWKLQKFDRNPGYLFPWLNEEPGCIAASG